MCVAKGPCGFNATINSNRSGFPCSRKRADQSKHLAIRTVKPVHQPMVFAAEAFSCAKAGDGIPPAVLPSLPIEFSGNVYLRLFARYLSHG
jgi:hypothetical protein